MLLTPSNWTCFGKADERAAYEAQMQAKAEAKAKKKGQPTGAEVHEARAPSRTMRERRLAKLCPTCKTDLAEFLETAQINRCFLLPAQFCLGTHYERSSFHSPFICRGWNANTLGQKACFKPRSLPF